MLDSTKKKNYSETKVVTIIGPGTTVTGEIKSKGTIRIEGVMNGRIHSDDTIVIQESGQVKADLVAGQVVISGEVRGNVYAHDRLEVTSKGRLIGDITAPRVSIAEGVLFEGKCTMKAPGQVKLPGMTVEPEEVSPPGAVTPAAAPHPPHPQPHPQQETRPVR